TGAALAAAARNLAEHLRERPETDLGDAAFTLLAGRQTFEHRLAVVCRDAADAAACLAGPDPERALSAAEETGDPEARRLAAAGRRWLAGQPLDAMELFAGQERRRIPLPTYPFERHRYWIEPVGIEPVGTGPAAGVQSLHTRPDLATPYVAPRSDLEERVAAVWRQVLGVAEVGVHDSFLELGGDSLLATRLMSRLREELAVELPMERLFAQPTVAAVAAAVVEARAQQAGGEDLARLLAEIGGLSDEELERELTRNDEEELPV
ncbi:MAG TPA: phosphopantetheine-binding protein, partial [Thermoanaerobaculia bacterium]